MPVNNVLSTTTMLYKCIVPFGSSCVYDCFSNVVYFISCDKCKLQYVAKTSQNLNERLN